MNLFVKNLTVEYPRKKVLKNLSCVFEEGKIHSLVGENGAGKSTLVKILCGEKKNQSGEIYSDKKKFFFNCASDAIKEGIVCVHQNPLLAENVSVLENLRLGLKKFNKNQAEKLFFKWMPDVKINSIINDLPSSVRFFTSLTCALLKNPEVLILDEPGALLEPFQKQILYSELKKFANSKMNVIVITHDIDDAILNSDTITVLDKGIVKLSCESKNVKKEEIQNLFFKQNDFLKIQKKDVSKKKESVLSVKFENICAFPKNKPVIHDLNFNASGFEITLISGKSESGIFTLEDVITGMSEKNHEKGKIIIEETKNSQKIRYKEFNLCDSFSTLSLRKKSGFRIGIIPSDRNFRSSNPNLTIEELLCTGKNFNSKKDSVFFANSLIQKAFVNIKPDDFVFELSGGMLQRLIIERELSYNPEILILCDPLQGLDFLSSQKLCLRLTEISSKGVAIIVLSAVEFPESICSRIYNVSGGKIL